MIHATLAEIQAVETELAATEAELMAMAQTDADIALIQSKIAPLKTRLETLKAARYSLDIVATTSLDSLTLKQLKALAKLQGFKGYSHLRKAELLMGLKDLQPVIEPVRQPTSQPVKLATLKQQVRDALGLTDTQAIKKFAIAQGWIDAKADLRTKAAWATILKNI